jgi:NADH-quinone oxidoreductase subunit L
MTHAFFKALLFLGAGSVIHALSDEQDLRRMGGLSTKLPWTHGVMLVATLAICGLPPLAGFFSKDEILGAAFASGHYGVWTFGMLGAVLTAFYMFRLYILCFRGESRLSHEAAHHLHESPPLMIAPLVVLAVLSLVGGWIGLPFQEGGHPLARWLAPVFAPAAGGAHGAAAHAAHHLSVGTEWLLIIVSVIAALVGIALAFRIYGRSIAEPLEAKAPALQRLLANKYWVDELYDALVVRPLHGASQVLWRVMDAKVIDGAVNGLAGTFGWVSAVSRLFQTGFVGTYALFLTLGVAAVVAHFLWR